MIKFQLLLVLAIIFIFDHNTIANSRTTFILNEVTIAKDLLPEKPLGGAVKINFGNVEAFSQSIDKTVICEGHPFVNAVHHSFATHRPLTITPDHIWLLIVQGLAAHVYNNAESLRAKFVKHKGKIALVVRRDDFIKGKKDNPWEEVFPEFSRQIGEHIGKDNEDLISKGFSTSSIVNKAAFQITLMDMMQHYFSYDFFTICGIPSITLEGTPEDWEDILNRTRQLEKYDLKWWTDELVPILKEFVDASKGIINKKFWNSIYKLDEKSGEGPYITGWVVNFFPYLTGYTKMPSVLNPVFKPEKEEVIHITMQDIPGGLSMAPFKWHYRGKIYNMDFIAGFIGISQNAQTKNIKPEIGWVIRKNWLEPDEDQD
jgi:hypothetical protein